jgi:galactokinase
VSGRTDEALRAAERAFTDLTGEAPTSRLFVPGRIEVLGKHTDYAGGHSLTCAVERGFAVVYRPRADGMLRVTDALDGRLADFPVAPDITPPVGEWANYPMTVARRLARNFPGLEAGADVAFLSTLPRAAGMSTSSALVTATYLVLEDVNALRSRPEYAADIGTREGLAGYLGSIENGQGFGRLAGDHGVGTFGGSEDHTAIVLSRAGHLGYYHYGPVTREALLPLPDDLTFVVAASGVAAAKTGAARSSYNRASTLVRALLAAWHAATGRDDATLAAAVSSGPSAVDTLRRAVRGGVDDLSAADLERRLDHFLVEETEVLPQALAALGAGDVTTFGALTARSQEAAETLLGNQVPETAALARLARQHGALAASAFGAGFGGSVWALVPAGGAARFASAWQQAYAASWAAAAGATFFVTRPGPGAGPVTNGVGEA